MSHILFGYLMLKCSLYCSLGHKSMAFLVISRKVDLLSFVSGGGEQRGDILIHHLQAQFHPICDVVSHSLWLPDVGFYSPLLTGDSCSGFSSNKQESRFAISCEWWRKATPPDLWCLTFSLATVMSDPSSIARWWVIWGFIFKSFSHLIASVSGGSHHRISLA